MSPDRSFPAVAASIADARAFVLGALPPLPGSIGAVVALLTSELATNAVKYGGARFTLHVTPTDGAVRVEVADPSDRTPIVRTPEPMDPSGRGLQIVADLADSWGVSRDGEDGKVVWFELGIEDAERER
jgi:anti-sigma regulatory factor (Ser/Thr protein kinase)